MITTRLLTPVSNLSKTQSVTTAPSFVWECSVLSEHVYNGKDKPALPPGWSIFPDGIFEIDSYRGICYVKGLGTTDAKVIFAHRGTANIKNLTVDDVLVFLGKMPRFLHEITNWTYTLLPKLGVWNEKGGLNPNIIIGNTGIH